MPVPNDSIDTFLDALWLEEGLARSTLDAYRRDLTLYAASVSYTHLTLPTNREV